MFEVERTAVDLSSIPPQAQKAIQPGAPPQFRAMAAKGSLPGLNESQNLLVLYTIGTGTDAELAAQAKASAPAFAPPEVLASAVQSVEHPGVLDWLADAFAKNSQLLQGVVTNRATNSNTIARVARRADSALCEIIATNQVRLLEAPQIIEQMYLNANARVATVDRVIELAQREGVELKGIPGLNKAMNSGQDIFGGGADADIFEELLAKESAKGDSQDVKTADLENMTRAEREAAEAEAEVDPEDERNRPLHAQIQNMSIAQKIRLATVGSREAVHILVQDNNKLVNSAAVQSPRVKPADAIKWAKNKSLSDNVISYIANKREWASKYECMVNLVENPKTPLPEALGFLVHLRNNDLRGLQRNRNIPGQLRRQAKTLYDKRTGGNKKG